MKKLGEAQPSKKKKSKNNLNLKSPNRQSCNNTRVQKETYKYRQQYIKQNKQGKNKKGVNNNDTIRIQDNSIIRQQIPLRPKTTQKDKQKIETKAKNPNKKNNVSNKNMIQEAKKIELKLQIQQVLRRIQNIISRAIDESGLDIVDQQKKQMYIFSIINAIKGSITQQNNPSTLSAFKHFTEILELIENCHQKLKQQMELKQTQRQKVYQNTKKYKQIKDFSKFFCANILREQEFEQEFLYNVVKKYCGRIQATRLIYIWDKLHKTNIHQYIDNKPNLMFLILTEEGYRIAVFTENSFKKPFPDIGFGAIISLSNRKVFTVKPNQRAISYDGIYVIFGKNELVIKGNEISSNLGNAGGLYDSKGEKAQILFNEGSKSATKIAQLEIYQIEN